MRDFFRSKNIDLVDIHLLQYLNRPSVKIGCRLIGIDNSAGCRIKNNHDGYILHKKHPEALFTLPQCIIFLLLFSDINNDTCIPDYRS